MRSRALRAGAAVVLLVLAASAGAGLTAEEPADTLTREDEERVEQILSLRHTLRLLIDSLPPHLAAEVERRWAEQLEAAQQAAGETSSVSTPAEEKLREATESAAEPSSTGRRPDEAGEEPPRTATADEPRDAGGRLEPPPATATGAAPRAPSTTASPPVEPPREPVAPPTRLGCDTLSPLDTNEDGQISGADRYWRHLRLWRDGGDDQIASSEVTTPFELGIRSIDVGLRSFSMKNGSSHDIWLEDQVRFALPRGERSAYLLIDADALARGRSARLTDAQGRVLTGLQPIRRGVRWQTGDGQPRPLRCGR